MSRLRGVYAAGLRLSRCGRGRGPGRVFSGCVIYRARSYIYLYCYSNVIAACRRCWPAGADDLRELGAGAGADARKKRDRLRVLASGPVFVVLLSALFLRANKDDQRGDENTI